VSLGRYKKAQPLLEEALRINLNADIHRITTLNNLAYLYLLQGRFGEVEPLYQEVQNIQREGLELGDPATFVGEDKITWVVSIIVDSGDGVGGFSIDCSMFNGGTGPFNPDPETGGDLAQCAPFGTMPTYGMWGGWRRIMIGELGNNRLLGDKSSVLPIFTEFELFVGRWSRSVDHLDERTCH